MTRTLPTASIRFIAISAAFLMQLAVVSSNQCPPQMVFETDVMPCHPTCFEWDADSEDNCFEPRTDMCVCEEQFDMVYWNETIGCIDAFDCPCEDVDGSLHERGDVWYSDGCTIQNTCTDCDDCDRQVGKVEIELPGFGNSFCLYGDVCQTQFGREVCGPALVVGGWGDWTAWSACTDSCGMGTQTRSRLCDNPEPANGGSDCIGSDIGNRECVCEWDFNPDVHCKTCKTTDNIVGYVRDECQCGRYYQCQKKASGVWEATKRDCPACLYWDEDVISCAIRVPGCVAPSTPKPVPTAAPVCLFEAVDGNPEQYSEMVNGQKVIRDCAPGTEFYQSKCVCAAKAEEPIAPPKEISCISFDNGFTSSNGLWIDPIRVRTGSGHIGRGAYFNRNKKARIEIPRFSNSYRSYKKYAISFWFKRKGSYSGEEGLMANGNCEQEPSIGIMSHDGAISAQLITNRGRVSIADIPATNNKWHHVVLSYTGKKAILYVDNIAHKMGDIRGRIDERHCPMVIGHSSPKKYFNGYVDELCFYRTGLSPAYVNYLFNQS